MKHEIYTEKLARDGKKKKEIFMFIKKSEKGKQKKKIFYRLEGANEAAGIVSLCEMPLRMNIIIAL